MTLDVRSADRSKPRRVHYPERDGKPMGETDRHIQNTAMTLGMLRLHFAEREDVYVAANNLLYFEEGNPRERVSPDGYVVFGVSPELRRSYYVWKEGGRTPDIVFEFTSRSSQTEDVTGKRELYEKRLRVPEYILFDPDGDYLRPRLQGFRLSEGRYIPIPLENERLFSDVLDLEVFAEGTLLRFYDPVKSRVLPTWAEQAARAQEMEHRAQEEAQRAQQEAQRAASAEAEVARLREELARLKAE